MSRTPVSNLAGHLTCWVISDGRRGIENQALGLSEALQNTCAPLQTLSVTTHVIENKGLFAKAPASLQFALKPSPQHYELQAPYPDIVIGCGRQAIAPLRALKDARGDDIFTIYVQDPRMDTDAFDLVIAPQHDGLVASNVETMIGSPNRITHDVLDAAAKSFSEQLAPLPTQKIAMLIGGPSRSHQFTRKAHEGHMQAALHLLSQGYGLMVTTSRRTPDWAAQDYHALTKEHDNLWLYDGHSANPYFAFLATAKAILVTEESTNMLTESCATSAKVFRLSMEGQASKFDQLYAALETRCGVQRFEQKQFEALLNTAPHMPLSETSRIAETIWAHYEARHAALN